MNGLASALIATLAFSINAPLVHAASKKGANSFALVAIRNITALLLLLPFADFRVALSTLLVVLSSAISGPGLGDYFYFKAISHSGVAVAVTIGYTYIFTTQFFSALMGVEPVRSSALLGALLAFLGVVITLGGRPRGPGVLYGFITSLLWGFASALLGMAAKETSPYTIAVVRSAVLSLVFIPFSKIRTISTSGLIYAVLSGAIGLALGSLAFIYAMAYVGVATTVITTSLTPILSQIFDKAINKTSISPKYILGALLVGLGITTTVMIN